MKNVKNLSNEQLKKTVQQYQTELENREKVIVDRVEKENHERITSLLAKLSEQPELLDLLVPKHVEGRYEPKICSDDNPHRASVDSPKDWYCPRCRILSMIREPYFYDFSHVNLEFYLL